MMRRCSHLLTQPHAYEFETSNHRIPFLGRVSIQVATSYDKDLTHQILHVLTVNTQC